MSAPLWHLKEEIYLYFAREIDRVLAHWAAGDERKPLVLRGARQTGKSSSVRQLGRSFELFLELNLERYEDLALVRSCRSPAEDRRDSAPCRHLRRRAPRGADARRPPVRYRLLSLPLYLAEEMTPLLERL